MPDEYELQMSSRVQEPYGRRLWDTVSTHKTYEEADEGLAEWGCAPCTWQDVHLQNREVCEAINLDFNIAKHSIVQFR